MNTEEEKVSIQIATTIQQQLMATGQVKVCSWGANSWKAITNGLCFKVQGFKFQGDVAIILMPNDSYKIVLVKGEKLIKQFNDIYFDEMVDLIDRQVEFTGANYENDVNNAVYQF